MDESMRETIVSEVASSPLLRGDHLAELTSELVKVPSVNGEHGEAALATVIERRLRETGCEVARVWTKPGRPSIAARVRGRSDEHDAVVLNGHMDTVPVDDPTRWALAPFGGAIADGFVHGRGACDMKGALATQIAIAQFLAAREHPAAGSLVLHFAMGEERGEPGTLSLLEAGFVGRFGVTLEPTNLHIGVAARGMMTFHVTVTGRSAHASRPDAGDNPIRWLPALVQAFADEDALVRTTSQPHPLLGSGSWTVTNVHSGVFASAIPDRCDVLIDRRLLPNESVAASEKRCRELVAAAIPSAQWTVEIDEGEGIYEPAEVSPHAEVVRRLQAAIAATTGGIGPVYGTPYASDVRNLVNDAGIEAVTFGAGDIAWTHCVDERIAIAELETAARCVAAFVLDVIG